MRDTKEAFLAMLQEHKGDHVTYIICIATIALVLFTIIGG
jgi:hypothetical protein